MLGEQKERLEADQLLDWPVVVPQRPKVVPVRRVVDSVLLELHEPHLQMRDRHHLDDMKQLVPCDPKSNRKVRVVEEAQLPWDPVRQRVEVH